MGRLDRQLRENMERNEANNKKKSKRTPALNNSAPSYDVYGNSSDIVITKKKIDYKKLVVPVAILFTFIMVIYLPQIMYKGEPNTEFFDTAADSTAIKLSSQYVKDCPDDDFDGDGLANYKEEEYGCNPFAKDSDRDGVSDYAEVITYKTSPVKTNSTLVNYIRQKDAEKGNSIDTPYKMGDVILWADSYTDKTYGGVIETFDGYRFHSFKGWAKFASGKYAYKYENGKHTLLQYREKEDAWRIEEDMVVLVYDKKLEMANHFILFGNSMFSKSNFFTDFLSFVLPDDAGILRGQKIAKIDADPDLTTDVEVDFKLPKYDENELERFGTSFDSLHVLIKVREYLDKNQAVAVSLFSSSRGENIGVVTGYTADGRLIVCNTNGDFLGYITIYEKAAYMLNEEKEMVTRQWFTFEGLGYSSSNWDRISFFGVSENDDANIKEDKEDSEIKEDKELETDTTVDTTENSGSETPNPDVPVLDETTDDATDSYEEMQDVVEDLESEIIGE